MTIGDLLKAITGEKRTKVECELIKLVAKLDKYYPGEWSIGGSASLKMMGILKTEPNDIDITVLPNTRLDYFIRLVSQFGLDGFNEYEKDEYVDTDDYKKLRVAPEFQKQCTMFCRSGVKIDFFIGAHKQIKYKSLNFTDPIQTLNALKSYKRDKDIEKIKLIELSLKRIEEMKGFYNQF